ncbi:TIGR02680 family protein [Catenuloplanes sp. NPDC051500]|uniref:TIGR02680 family protein n=1 Tax=Catenuloplanes sp. NPDC051500 TaxID=3363959 RepID=UPI0037AFB739
MTLLTLPPHQPSEDPFASAVARQLAGQLRSDRWAPTRAGVLNVWRYFDEIFTFHHGRLLLRGPNGTGKSKALELLLPFLFDASLRPSRLSTFGGSERTMHWNLMGDGYPHTTRVGYVWLEFGRTDETGAARWFTCGARLAASSNTRTVDATYFTTGSRVGVPGGFSLVKPGNVPLTKPDLTAAIEGHGTVHAGAEAYRTAVRDAVFHGLSDAQYEALIATLLQLRTPKLSEHLNPDALSEVLSKALPPLDPSGLTEIAEGFERLDHSRERLSALDAEVDAATRLAERQQQYARRALRRGAGDLINATDELDEVSREATRQREAHATAVAELAEVTGRREELERDAALTEEAIGGLRDSAAFREGRQLDEFRSGLRETRNAALAAEEICRARRTDADRDQERAETRRAELASASAAMERSWHDTIALARRAGLSGLVEPLANESSEQARALLRGVLLGREGQVDEVRAVIDAHRRAAADRERAAPRREARAADRDEAQQTLTAARTAYEERVARHRESIAAWASACTVLPVAPVAPVLADLGADEVALASLIGDVTAEVRERIAADHTAGMARDRELLATRTPLSAEYAALTRRPPAGPPAPVHRTAARDENRPGAPLWRVVTWHEGVPPATQAAVEAALQASGLLDAWIRPDGAIALAVDGHDTSVASMGALPAAGDSLLSILDAVAPERGTVPVVAPTAVRQILNAIGYAESAPRQGVGVGADGTWRLGLAYGSWSKPAAEFLGPDARERARQRRLAELAGELAALDAAREKVAVAIAGLRTERATLDAEAAARPSLADGARALEAVQRAELRLAAVHDQLDEAESDLATADEAARATLRDLTLTGSRQSLPTTPGDLEQLADALRALRQAGEGWLADRARRDAATERLADAEEAEGRSAAAVAEAEDTLAAAREKADAAQTRLESVESAVGTDFSAVLDQVDVLRARAVSLKRDERTLRPRHDELISRISDLNARADAAERARDAATAERDAAVARLARLAGLLGPDAGLETRLTGLGAATATLQAARAIAEECGSLPHGPRHLRQDESALADVLHTIRESLTGYADLSMEADEQCDVQVVSASVDGLRISPAQLAARVTTERDETHAMLGGEERDLFDRTLTGDTRRHVAERIRQATGLVRQVSAQLEQVRTVSGLGVRLVWEVNPELGPDLKQARDLLLADPGTLSDAERGVLHDFFRARIDELRTTGAASGWDQQLSEVLDYRRWHRFVVQMRSGGDEWAPVTRKQHGAKSGGEKAIVLHLPLFAAAAAHYRAAPEAPRLILLDEVFVGVDQMNRGQLMEVLTGLDLDLMLTSDQEWCTYSEVDGIAIHQLIAGDADGDDAVTTARFVWTGQDFLPADEPRE